MLISVSQYLVQVIILAAVSLTTAGLAAATLGLTLPPPQIALALLVLALILSMTGGFRWMEIVTKGFVVLLTVATVTATALVVPDVDWSVSNLAFPELDAKLLFFLVALIGLMPATLDLSILHSLWAKAKNHDDVGADLASGSHARLRHRLLRLGCPRPVSWSWARDSCTPGHGPDPTPSASPAR